MKLEKILPTLFSYVICAQMFAQNISPVNPTYISKMPITEYNLFANAGWNGNWYIGYNQCWIEKLKINLPKNEFSKVFVGAKIGRMKSIQKEGRPSWEREPIKGEIYIAVSSTPVWKKESYRLLTKTEDIPIEYDYENALDNTGECRWFWTEYPINEINFSGDNFICLWSPNEFMTSASSAPILAAAWGNKEVDSWINTEITGTPPQKDTEALKTPITIFEPAIAIKLIPINKQKEIFSQIVTIVDSAARPTTKIIQASVHGDHIERVYLELSTDGKHWTKISKILYNPPYFFTIDPQNLPSGKIAIRVVAVDIWENYGYSKPVEMVVTKDTKQKK